MAFISHQMDFPIRSRNKEPEWSTVYDDLFAQYIDTDHFDFGNGSCERSSLGDQSSQDFGFDFALPNPDIALPSIEEPVPSRGLSQGLWADTYHCLEEKGSSIKNYQRRSKRSEPDTQPAACNPDFLSLGGHPSPQLLGSPYSFSRPRTQVTTQSPTRASFQPSGVRKTIRSTKSTPNMMMSPSRYRAGLKEVWRERVGPNGNINPVKLPSYNPPLSPPHSTDIEQIAGSNASSCEWDARVPQTFSAYDSQISPLTQHFQRTQLYTPIGSPYAESFAPDASSWNPAAFDYNSVPLEYRPTAMEPAHSSWNAQRSSDSDGDSPLSPSYNPWNAANATTHQIPLAPPAPMYRDNQDSGLMINYDPLLIQNLDTISLTEPEMLLPLAHQKPQYYTQSTEPFPPLPPTPKRNVPVSRERSTSGSHSPPPTRSRRAASKTRGTSRIRSQSRQRRSKSSGPRQPRAPRSASQGGFVNFTPADSGKLLTGVAPSGSSKTKARREKEAADRRRRFSQAAVRAVVEAGGDLNELRGAGIVL